MGRKELCGRIGWLLAGLYVVECVSTVKEDLFTLRLTEPSFVDLYRDPLPSQLSLGWDDPLPISLQRKWQNWKESLAILAETYVPRCFLQEKTSQIKKAEIHAFSDGSDLAIGIAVYLKLTNQSGEIKVSLVFAQAKLAPKRATTIPRLELCAAVLAVKAVKWITHELKIKIDEIFFHTDSKVVLGYLQNESKRFYVYVANRIQVIRTGSDPSQWHYVKSSENPADMATRGKPAKDLLDSIWFTGPHFLRNSSFSEPSLAEIDPMEYDVSSNDPEVCTQVTRFTVKPSTTQGLGSERFKRFSKLSSLRKAIANLIIRIKRVKTNNRDSISSRRSNALLLNATDLTKHPTAAELKQSEEITIKTVQMEQYATKFKNLQQIPPASIPATSSLYRLNPFIDSNGILRVGGRLRHGEQMYEEKHLAIIPKKSHLAKLVIKHYHEKVYHQRRQITHGAIRNAGLWVIGAKRTISKIINECLVCKKLRRKLMTQFMADRPADQLNTPPPFTNVGFDMFGPWTNKNKKLRGGAVNFKNGD
ncbi:uncharacterized protein LOC114535468 [Dendronephthya gigantea]|uniref:uncharacterized protein LOC114535468 n=1 Tax=Dendronephthya gigantea TaxID=151771 RepID=UPI0010695FD5|nr:uncharacterized protein LOC114535468 [Dendronephthya gigantea]